MASVSQALAFGQPAPGFPQIPSGGNLGLTNAGLKIQSFTALKNASYILPTGITVTLPTPTGSGAFIALTVTGAGVATLSGTVSVGGTTLTSYPAEGGQTLIICDASATTGWT